MDGGAAAEAGAGTFNAACALEERDFTPDCRVKAAGFQDVVGMMYRLLATLADHPHQTLREHAVQSGDEIVRLNPHVKKAAYDIHHVVGMHRGEHQVAGERGLNGDLCGLAIADLAHHDLVRIVAQDRAHPSSEGHPLLLLDRYLCDAVNLAVDWILEREGFVLLR